MLVCDALQSLLFRIYVFLTYILEILQVSYDLTSRFYVNLYVYSVALTVLLSRVFAKLDGRTPFL